MAILAQWGSTKFQITESAAMLINKIKISVECETKDKNEISQKYVAAKNGKPLVLSMTILLNAALGVNVKDTALALLNSAQRSGTGYFYIGGSKVFPFKLMLTKADTEEITLGPSGAWISTSVNVTFKQCEPTWFNGKTPQPAVTTFSTSGSGTAKASASLTSLSGNYDTSKNINTKIKAASTAAVAQSVKSAVKTVVNTISSAKSVKSTVNKNTKTSSGATAKVSLPSR